MNKGIEKILIIDSKHFTEQDANDLTINFDEYLDNVKSIRITFAGIPCTFYNISDKLNNNNLLFHDGTKWGYLNFPDGYYDLETYSKQLSSQLKINGHNPKAITISLDESTGKIIFSFKKGEQQYKVSIRSYNANLLGFKIIGSDGSVELPRYARDPNDRTQVILEQISLGDKPINFRPFEYFHIHCDLINTENVLYNGKRSDLLSRVLIKACDFGETISYNLGGLRERSCFKRFNKMRIWITNENNESIDYNGADIQYEFLFYINE